MILQPGQFRVSDYRKAIPDWVKVQVVMRAMLNGDYWLLGYGNNGKPIDARTIRYDHRPPLQDRPLDSETGDFIPPQNDPDHIEPVKDTKHDERTFGRKEGAEKTVSTINSDAHNRKRVRNLSRDQAEHDLKMAAKAGDTEAMKQVVANLEKDRRKPKVKIKSRGFDKRHRPMRRAS